MSWNRPFTFDRVVRLVIRLAILAGGIWLINLLRSALLPFALGLLLAYLLEPAVRFFQVRLKFRNRIVSLFTVLALVGLVIGGIFAALTPLVVHETTDLYYLVRRYVENAEWTSGELPHQLQERIREFLRDDDILSLLDPKTLGDAAKTILPRLWVVVSDSYSALAGLLGLLIILLYVIFILADYDKLINGWKAFLPAKQSGQVEALATDFTSAMGVYFRAQSLIALCNALMFALGFWLIGLPLGIVLGLLVGLLNLVPYLQNLGIIPAAFLALMRSLETGQSFWLLLALVLVVFAVVGIVEQVILTPRIMGHATGLNPAFILLSLSIWGSLLGLLGLVIALPLTTVMVSYYRRFLLPEWQSWSPPPSAGEIAGEAAGEQTGETSGKIRNDNDDDSGKGSV